MKIYTLVSVVTLSGVAFGATKNRQDELFDHMDGGVLDANEALDIDKMSEEEKKEKLVEICKKIDYNDDGKLSKEELQRWMEKVSTKYMEDDIAQQWPAHDKNNDDKLTWDEYKDSVFGFMTEEDFKDQDMTMEQMVARDKRRFDRADVDKTGDLSKAEFGAFLHPEDHAHMKDIIVEETLEDLDKNGDGFVDEDEYIGDMYKPEHPDEEPPEWLEVEKEHFKTIRDQDGDGLMGKTEVRDWLMPIEYDHIDAEAAHLILECDADEDGFLDTEEVLKKYDVFMTSQATNWGEALAYHDEL
jgi:Ca2+-binding EF-hand superfamily protein